MQSFKIFSLLSLILITLLVNNSTLAESCPPKPQKNKLLFSELRYIPHVNDPVKVSGYLEIEANDNFTWESDGEYASKIIREGSQTRFFMKEDGEWVESEKNQFLEVFLEINLNLTSSAANHSEELKNSKLNKICIFNKDKSWTLTLTPKSEDTQIKEIKLEGKDNPERFLMELKNGFRSLVSYY